MGGAESLPPARTPFRWPDWFGRLKRFQRPDAWTAGWQVVNTLGPYLALWALMAATVERGYPYAVTLALAVPAAGLLVRVFILFHDCVHDSFFPWKAANTVLGYLCGTLVFTPLEDWRFTHLKHHGTYANLDARGVGDITTLTVEEYRALPRGQRLRYRLYRNPLVLFVIGPLFHFLIRQRWPSRAVSRKARRSVWITDALLAAILVGAWWTVGLRTYLLVQLPVIWLAGAGGVWLFYVQHQFPGVYWARRPDWSPLRAAFEGSSFYDLPPLLRWLSGNIGYHFIHHLRPRIPNYRLRACYEAVPELREKKPLGIRESLSTIRLKLWDEANGRLVGFPPLREDLGS